MCKLKLFCVWIVKHYKEGQSIIPGYLWKRFMLIVKYNWILKEKRKFLFNLLITSQKRTDSKSINAQGLESLWDCSFKRERTAVVQYHLEPLKLEHFFTKNRQSKSLWLV